MRKTHTIHTAPSRGETAIQRDIMAALGAEADLLVLRNSVGLATHTTPDGRTFRVAYGLLPGSPDLVGILAPLGRWFCLEVKRPGERATDDQHRVHTAWRRMGAFVRTVTSVGEAVAALEAARRGEST